ncbi:hypothetical protein Tco_0883693 [Tanacetum coccineum]
MSSASSAVTYTSVYTDSEPGRVFWGADEKISDGGSPLVIVYGYDGLPMQLVAPPSPDYIPDSEELQTPPVPQDEDECEPMFMQPHDPDYVPEPMYPEYIPLEDEHEFPVEEQPLPPVVLPTVKSVSPPEGTEPVIPPPFTDITTTGARITVWLQASISLPPEAEVERLLAMPTPPPSPPISLSSPSAGELLAGCTAPSAHLSPPHMPSPLLPSSGCLTQIQTLKIASTQALINAVTAALPSPPLPPLSPSLYIPPPVNRRDDIPESERPPRKRSCLFSLGPRYEVEESSTARPTGVRGVDYRFVNTLNAKERRRGIIEVGYGIRDTWMDPTEAVLGIAPMTMEVLGYPKVLTYSITTSLEGGATKGLLSLGGVISSAFSENIFVKV